MELNYTDYVFGYLIIFPILLFLFFKQIILDYVIPYFNVIENIE